MFFIVFFLILTLFSYLIIKHSIWALNIPVLIKVVLSAGLLFSAWSYSAIRFLDMTVNPLLDHVSSWGAYLFLGYISFWGLAFLGLKISSLLSRRRVQKTHKRTLYSGNKITRREFLRQGSVYSLGLLPMAPVGVGVKNAFTEPELITQQIVVPERAFAMKGLKAVQISDLHIGSLLMGDWLEALVKRVNALEPDLIFITGDLVDGTVESLKEDISHLADLQAVHGVYAVTGNHEFYSGVDSWVVHLRALGLTVLTNAHRIVDIAGSSLLIAGMWDHAGYRFGEKYREDVGVSVDGASTYDYSIMLAHQPNSIELSARASMDLQLSGHTHSGQYWPFTEVVKLFQKYPKGLYQVEQTTLYVNIGTGFWGPPLRLASKNEITLLEFV